LNRLLSCRGLAAALLLLPLTCFSSALAILGWNKSEPVPSRRSVSFSAEWTPRGVRAAPSPGCLLPYHNTFIFWGAVWSATKFHSFQKVLEY
jgi:hypothetical protein